MTDRRPASEPLRCASQILRAAIACVSLVVLVTPDLSLAMVRLPPQEQSHLGLRTIRLAGVNRSGEIDGFAKVLDPGPLAQLVSDLQTALAAYAASSAEAARAKSLHSRDLGVSAKDTEAAVAQSTSDALRVTQLRRRLGLEWGPGVARLSDAERNRLVDELAKGTAALVHVDTHNNTGQMGAKRVRIDVGADSVVGVVIGPARAAEPRLQSSGLIVKVTGPSAILLSTGLTQSAHIATQDPQSGVIVPRLGLCQNRTRPLREETDPGSDSGGPRLLCFSRTRARGSGRRRRRLRCVCNRTDGGGDALRCWPLSSDGLSSDLG